MCLQTIRNLLGLTEIGKPKNIKKITASDIMQEIVGVLGYYPNFKMFDNDYLTTDFGEYDRFIQHSKIDWLTYESEYFDCDDSAIALWGEFTKTKYWSGLAFGQISVKEKSTNDYHALNIFITNDHEIYYCEPQNDKIWLMKNENDLEPYYIMF